MAQFAAYNTDRTTGTPDTAPGAGATVTIGPIEPGVDTKVAGSVFCDVVGTVYVEQTFEDPSLNHWDVVQMGANNNVSANTPVTINQDVIATFLRVRFVVGASPTTHLRIFVRTYGMNRG